MILETKECQNHGHALPSSWRGKKSLLTLYIIRYSIIQVILILLPKTAYNRHSFLAKMIEIYPQSTQTIILLISPRCETILRQPVDIVITLNA